MPTAATRPIWPQVGLSAGDSRRTDVLVRPHQIESGDPTAAEQLLPLVYDELRKLAAAKLLDTLSAEDPLAADLVKLRYFAGFAIKSNNL